MDEIQIRSNKIWLRCQRVSQHIEISVLVVVRGGLDNVCDRFNELQLSEIEPKPLQGLGHTVYLIIFGA